MENRSIERGRLHVLHKLSQLSCSPSLCPLHRGNDSGVSLDWPAGVALWQLLATDEQVRMPRVSDHHVVATNPRKRSGLEALGC